MFSFCSWGKNVKGGNKETLFDPLLWEILLKDFSAFDSLERKKWLHKGVIDWMQVGKRRAKKHKDGRGLVSTGGMATEPQYPRELGPFSLWSPFHCQATFACAKPIEPQVFPTVPKRKALDSARNAGAANTHCLGHFDHRHKSWELRNHSEPQLGGGELINQRNISCNRSLGFFLHLQA